MDIFVTAKLRAKEPHIRKNDETHFEVAVKKPPVAGRANEAIVRAVADYFGVSVSAVRIVSG